MKTRLEMSDGADSVVQMGPLIDVVFLLLIFFLVTATLKKAHKDLEIQLPHAASSIETNSQHETMIVEITKDGHIYLDKDPMTQQLLHKRLREAARVNPHRAVRIDADARAANYHVLHIMDICQYEGFNRVSLRARDKD